MGLDEITFFDDRLNVRYSLKKPWGRPDEIGEVNVRYSSVDSLTKFNGEVPLDNEVSRFWKQDIVIPVMERVVCFVFESFREGMGPDEETMSEPHVRGDAVVIKNINQMYYGDYSDLMEDSPHRLLCWEGNRWRKYIRDRDGVRWYGPEDISGDSLARHTIYSYFAPIAAKLDHYLTGNLEELDVRELVQKATNCTIPQEILDVPVNIGKNPTRQISEIFPLSRGKLVYYLHNAG